MDILDNLDICEMTSKINLDILDKSVGKERPVSKDGLFVQVIQDPPVGRETWTQRTRKYVRETT